jgi:hypothetical protein
MTFASSFRAGVLFGLAAAGAAAVALTLTRRNRAPASLAEPDYPIYDDPLDETTAQSFPASDPPSHAATLGAMPHG